MSSEIKLYSIYHMCIILNNLGPGKALSNIKT